MHRRSTTILERERSRPRSFSRAMSAAKALMPGMHILGGVRTCVCVQVHVCASSGVTCCRGPRLRCPPSTSCGWTPCTQNAHSRAHSHLCTALPTRSSTLHASPPHSLTRVPRPQTPRCSATYTSPCLYTNTHHEQQPHITATTHSASSFTCTREACRRANRHLPANSEQQLHVSKATRGYKLDKNPPVGQPSADRSARKADKRAQTKQRPNLRLRGRPSPLSRHTPWV